MCHLTAHAHQPHASCTTVRPPVRELCEPKDSSYAAGLGGCRPARSADRFLTSPPQPGAEVRKQLHRTAPTQARSRTKVKVKNKGQGQEQRSRSRTKVKVKNKGQGQKQGQGQKHGGTLAQHGGDWDAAIPMARAQREVSVRRGRRFVPSGYLAKLATFHNRQQRARNKGGLCDLVAEHISVNPYRDPDDVSFPLILILNQKVESGYPLLFLILSRDYLLVGFGAHCWLRGKKGRRRRDRYRGIRAQAHRSSSPRCTRASSPGSRSNRLATR